MAKGAITFKSRGYLEKSYADKEGGWHHSFEFSVKDVREHAKLVLMGRDLNKHCPVLLEVIVKISLTKDYNKNARQKSQTQVIR